MDNFEQRLQYVRNCAEEKSQLQSSCFKELELEGIESGRDVGKLRFLYEKCLRENTANYRCLKTREEVLKGNL